MSADSRNPIESRTRFSIIIETIDQLESTYGLTAEASVVKVSPVLTPEYRAMAEASPFVALATSGPEGLDCSPRGDTHRVLAVVNETTLHMPDRRGNNRIDSLRNIVRDPRVALLFLLPGCTTTLRINGEAHISIDPELLESFSVEDKPPRSVIVIHIHEVYFQRGRAIVRSDLWNPDRFVNPKSLPTPGEVLAKLSNNREGGESYDREWPSRASKTLW
ncbi:MAG: pyridoxamine 5'-phosphate oxidase family protein [Akkermansiaceae bacterium]|nr:pyridoxamine 5'-phosphate oxidase family protein [Akkermansiaceae bacterium]MDB4275889.1 pyridoxamine 5'-phosphate oxidase family protein [Akkermansiaceae bacterium]MDB4305736.1 pyridoxamine 5'-phosphate oxidase family protein [Akkermansiaceae bacterium]MDB4687960.1 pyridoxamine 5'-phosphate oxidase family protein [Akkermansiaceae bacterium]MDB4729432.1 pyridoxamine 5'-phosphate oxidase family protein [Akkermansiaceae bacterium]